MPARALASSFPASDTSKLLRDAIADGKARGRLIHDAQIVAVCREHGVDEIVSEDRDLARFRSIRALTLNDL